MTKIQETGEKVVANVERVIVGKHARCASPSSPCCAAATSSSRTSRAPARRSWPRRSRGASAASFRRIQFTPDLLPTDVTGLSIYNQKTQEFEFRPGPIMAQVVLADEINRATPKTQSALLECMEERQATVDGTTYPMPDPFLVIATQNPIEYEGTFALPEAQLDRFMLRLRLGYPQPIEEIVILDEQKRDPPARRPRGGRSASRSCARCRRRSARSTSTRPSPTTSSGSSTPPGTTPTSTSAPRRAARSRSTGPARRSPALLGRDYVIPDDVKALAEPALAHRLIIKTSSTIHDVQPGQVVRELLDTSPSRPPAATGRPARAARPREAAGRSRRRGRPAAGADATEEPTR